MYLTTLPTDITHVQPPKPQFDRNIDRVPHLISEAARWATRIVRAKLHELNLLRFVSPDLDAHLGRANEMGHPTKPFVRDDGA